MRKILLDMGGNMGQGLRQFINKYSIDENWIVETFEPEPSCELSKHISDLSYVKINNAAIWTYSGKVTFSRYESNLEGSSVECLMSEGYCSDPKSEGYRKHDDLVEVDCVGISELLNKYNDDDFIVVKMDIEGSEYNVIRKAIQDGTIKKVNDIWVEWHYNHVRDEDISTTERLKNQVRELGININDWH